MIWLVGRKSLWIHVIHSLLHTCNKEFNNENKKVKDRDHFIGKFRGSAYSECNLNLKMLKFVLMLIHNLKYDSEIFLCWLLKLRNKYDIQIILKNCENYTILVLGNFLFASLVRYIISVIHFFLISSCIRWFL